MRHDVKLTSSNKSVIIHSLLNLVVKKDRPLEANEEMTTKDLGRFYHNYLHQRVRN